MIPSEFAPPCSGYDVVYSEEIARERPIPPHTSRSLTQSSDASPIASRSSNVSGRDSTFEPRFGSTVDVSNRSLLRIGSNMIALDVFRER